MIKEDHLLACTTKMFEILVALPHLVGQTRLSRVTTWIVRTAQVHLSFRTHILAAIRLFTCQRASYPRISLGRLLLTPQTLVCSLAFEFFPLQAVAGPNRGGGYYRRSASCQPVTRTKISRPRIDAFWFVRGCVSNSRPNPNRHSSSTVAKGPTEW